MFQIDASTNDGFCFGTDDRLEIISFKLLCENILLCYQYVKTKNQKHSINFLFELWFLT